MANNGGLGDAECYKQGERWLWPWYSCCASGPQETGSDGLTCNANNIFDVILKGKHTTSRHSYHHSFLIVLQLLLMMAIALVANIYQGLSLSQQLFKMLYMNYLSHFLFIIALSWKYGYHSHLTDGKTEAQTGLRTCQGCQEVMQAQLATLDSRALSQNNFNLLPL